MLRRTSQLFLLFFFIISQAKSQNLVPNPSFENGNSTPACSVIQSRAEFSSYMQNWILPTDGTSDIFSTLAPATCVVNCSSSNYGPQLPRTGNSMCGFYIYESAAQPVNYREYLQVELLSPLIIGKRYYAEMYVSLSDLSTFGSNNIGMAFSDTQIGQSNYTFVIQFTPQIKNSYVITDINNWVKISGTFIATTPAQYLTIGNFYDNAATLSATNTAMNYGDAAYYYIDDVLVKLDCNLKDSSSTICKGSSITLDLNDDYITGWSLASSPNTILANTSTCVVSPQVTTTYIAHHDCGITSTFEVIVESPITFSFGNDTTICMGHTFSLNATTQHATYLWQDGSTNATYIAHDPGSYSVAIKNTCGTVFEDITLNLCCSGVTIPNLITPNGDGKNETFFIDCYGNGDYGLYVYNVWGAIVYRNTAYLNNWGGDNVSDGIYYYVIKFDNISINNGWVQVLR